MRLKITCAVLRPGQYISLNHQYELSSFIYHRLADADPGFAKMLHERGFTFDGEPSKVFRFFCFSNLFVPKKESKFLGHRIQVFARKVSFEVSFLLDRAAQYFIVGAFMNSHFGIGNEDGVLDLKVTGVEVLPEVNFDSPTTRFRLITPIYVSKPVEGADERLSSDHLSPVHEEYAYYFVKNLKRKYRAAVEHRLLNDMGDPQVTFRLITPLSNVRRKPRLIKKGRPGETRIIGYQYDFALTAPSTIQYLGYTVGWGGQNAQGFGLSKKI